MQFRAALVALFLLALVAPTIGWAQEWSWPERAENLEVLPKDISAAELRAVMRGFTRSLGVRCSYCHVGEEGQPLSAFDFVSDDNPKKDIARTMVRMLGVIRDTLQTIDPSGPRRVDMGCQTCHRGRPTTLGEELGEVRDEEGVDAAVAAYTDLRNRFYGRGSYDFGEGTLNDFGYQLLEESPADALAIFRLNAELFPQSAGVWDSLAEGYLVAGDRERAIEYYEKSLELDPENENAKEKLRGLRGG